MSVLSKKVEKEVRIDMQDRVDHLTAGRCKDYTEYRACCAELLGMHNATQLFLDVEKQYNNEGDTWTEEEQQ